MLLLKSRKLYLAQDVLLQLFDFMVVPILLHGAEFWGYEKNDVIEPLHLEFCKYILNIKKCLLYGIW